MCIKLPDQRLVLTGFHAFPQPWLEYEKFKLQNGKAAQGERYQRPAASFQGQPLDRQVAFPHEHACFLPFPKPLSYVFHPAWL